MAENGTDELVKGILKQLHNIDNELTDLIDRENRKGEEADALIRHAAEMILEDHQTFRDVAKERGLS
jgi:hypothetical protein